MCSYIVQFLQKITDTNVCYFFCDSQDTSDLYHRVLKTIVLQLVRQHPQEVSSLIANQYVLQTCGMVQLKALVSQLIQMFASTRIIIDGVDECTKEVQKMMLKGLQAIYSESNSHCTILFSSRKESGIASLLKQRQVCLDERAEVHSDIKEFVTYKLSSIETNDAAVLKRVEEILLRKANGNLPYSDSRIMANNSGMFLWVKLIIDELQACYSDAQLEETAENLPKGLKAA